MIARYAATLFVMLACDAVWLTTTMEPLYRRHLGHLLAPGMQVVPAVLFYLLYVAGIVTLTRQHLGWRAAGWRGCILGLTAYGTYDLTNQATLHDWPVIVTVADLAWGTVLTGTAAALGAVLSAWRRRTT